MMETRTYAIRNVDLEITGIATGVEGRCIFDVRGMKYATVQGHKLTGTWGTAVVTLRRTNDPAPGTDSIYGLESAVTMTSSSMTDKIDVTGFSYLVLETTTANGAACLAEFRVYAQEF